MGRLESASRASDDVIVPNRCLETSRGSTKISLAVRVEEEDEGAAEGAPFIAHHIIQAASSSFDDFAKSGADLAANRRMLGLT